MWKGRISMKEFQKEQEKDIKLYFSGYLSELQLSTPEIARMLSVSTRTIDRWKQDTTQIPMSVIHVLISWISLRNNNKPWRVDCISFDINEDKRYSTNRGALEFICKEVENTGSMSLPWKINLDKGNIILDKIIEIVFTKPEYCEPGYNFYIYGYRRLDNKSIERKHNLYLIEEAIFTIYQTLLDKNV